MSFKEQLPMILSLFSGFSGVCATLIGLVFVAYVFMKENFKMNSQLSRNETAVRNSESYMHFVPLFNLVFSLIVSLVMMFCATTGLLPTSSSGIILMLCVIYWALIAYCNVRFYISNANRFYKGSKVFNSYLGLGVIIPSLGMLILLFLEFNLLMFIAFITVSIIFKIFLGIIQIYNYLLGPTKRN
ncbi:hypothetical protein [Paenibacillus elgii]|uniref:hypothetical protein n=1 Tax=Paenibacillus elgii TaxID=189691 RepID=UPI0013D7396B|nr:hypothetical protein [Paenibacillus elgii]